MQCTKEFSINVNSVPPPSAYYKLEEASGDRIDSMAVQPDPDNRFTPTGGTDLGNAPGKIGNGIYYPGGIGSVSDYSTGLMVTIPYNPAGPGVSVGYWWKPLDTVFTGYQQVYFGFYDLQILHRISADRYYLKFQGNITDSIIDTAYPWVAGQWYFVVEQFRTSTSKSRFCVNAGAWTEAASPASGIGAFFDTFGAMNGLLGDVNGVLDELGLWMNVILSDSQVASLYNSGSGRTWP